MPTLASVQASVDSETAAFVTGLTTQQTTYKSTRSKFFQGLATCSDAALPNNTDAGSLQVVPQTLTSHPTDQTETWNQIGLAIPGSLHCSLTSDNYGSRLGQGWILRLRFKHNGLIWSKQTSVGSESGRTTGWLQVLASP